MSASRANRAQGRISAGLVVALTVGTMAFAAAPASAEPRYFETPEQASDAMRQALASAVESGDPTPVVELVGEEYRDAMLGDDESASADNRAFALERFEEFSALDPDGEDRRFLVIGDERWPVPVPVVRGEDGWFWDMADGVEEMIDRRVGANQLNAIAVLQAYVDGQRLYAWRDRDDDAVREYAQRIISTPGERDGLYWEAADGEPPSPFGPLVAEAREYQPGRDRGDPYFGYYFKVLTRQGDDAAGGSYDYVINGNMIGGFALLAFPADYGISGVMSFMVGQQGVIYQKDLGEPSVQVGEAIDTFDPDQSWEPVD